MTPIQPLRRVGLIAESQREERAPLGVSRPCRGRRLHRRHMLDMKNLVWWQIIESGQRIRFLPTLLPETGKVKLDERGFGGQRSVSLTV